MNSKIIDNSNDVFKYFNINKYIKFLKEHPRLQNLHKINNKNLKYFFFDENEEIKISDAPFGFIKTTHKLNNLFMKKFILNTKKRYGRSLSA